MKLSNKILIGFFGLIFIYMTAAFTEIRFKGDPNQIDEFNGIAETVGIAGVNYLILPDLEQSISIIGSNDPRIEVRSIKGDVLQYLKYEVAGDTLTIKQFDLEEKSRVKLYIHVPKTRFAGVTMKDAGVSIGELDVTSLSINQYDGWIRIGENNKMGKLNLKAVHDAYFNINGGSLDSLFMQIDASQLSINSPVRVVEGTMSNDSYVTLQGTEEIRFKKDESSRLVLN
jgi:hypothetical protein